MGLKRLARGDTDPETGRTFTCPPREAVLTAYDRVVVDEAGMLDQDTAHALLTITATSAAGVYVGMTRGRETNRLHIVR